MKFARPLLYPLLALAFALGLAAQTAAPAKAKSASAKSAATHAASQVDINTATIDELKAVPGIGDAYANKIVAGRPYKNKAQLKSKGVLPDGVYDKTKDSFVAKQKK
jgi:competence protein ComEA